MINYKHGAHDYARRIDAMTNGDRKAAEYLFAECCPHLLMTGSTPFGRYRSAQQQPAPGRAAHHAVAAVHADGAAETVFCCIYGALTLTALRKFIERAGEAPGRRLRAIAAGGVTTPAFRFAARNGIGVLSLRELDASAIRWDDMLSCLDRIGAGQPPVLQMRLEPQIAA